MRAGLLRLADQLRQSYWFLPSLMALAAVLLAGGMVWLDSYEGSGWMDRLPWLYASRPSGARQLLSAIGGSMVTVAGTVFSVTIAAVVYASGQYGPRLLSNFMRDRGNQVTLGTFIATFLYCLIVLRTIRSPEETGGAGFVPNLAVLIALLLAVCSITVLIFFIHHVPSRIHINSVIEDIGRRLLHEVGRRFPQSIGDAGRTAAARSIRRTTAAIRGGSESAGRPWVRDPCRRSRRRRGPSHSS
ncbi:putative membrane protein [Sphingomonas desiccabilis]|nr:putative membrane protein [Sphingomonas desiccabilis]